MLVTTIDETMENTEQPAEEWLRRSVVADGALDLPSSRFIEFTLTDDAVIDLSGPEDLETVEQLTALLERDRSLGAGSLDARRLYILFRVPNGPCPGVALVAARTDLEGLIKQEFVPFVNIIALALLADLVHHQSDIKTSPNILYLGSRRSKNRSFPRLGRVTGSHWMARMHPRQAFEGGGVAVRR